MALWTQNQKIYLTLDYDDIERMKAAKPAHMSFAAFLRYTVRWALEEYVAGRVPMPVKPAEKAKPETRPASPYSARRYAALTKMYPKSDE